MKKFTIGIILLGLLYVLRTSLSVKNTSYKISEENYHKLAVLGAESIKNLDVPVASIIIYHDSILGKGFNTVNRDLNIAGHAEINAISDAIKKIGFKKFNNIKDSVLLITTFEPCQMCKGAILEYNIKNLVFLKKKSLFHWLKNDWHDLKYEFRKQQAKEDTDLQDSLFWLYPNYKPN